MENKISTIYSKSFIFSALRKSRDRRIEKIENTIITIFNNDKSKDTLKLDVNKPVYRFKLL
jgi:hypothetical protein